MKLNVLNTSTCYEIHSKHGVNCNRKSCEHWINSSSSNNCVVIGASSGPQTLQDVGNIFGLTRMRMCQIEHSLIARIKSEQNIVDADQG